MPDEQPDYLLTIRAGPSSCPPIVRLRKVLKILGRSFAFRVVRVEEVPRAGLPAPENRPADATAALGQAKGAPGGAGPP